MKYLLAAKIARLTSREILLASSIRFLSYSAKCYLLHFFSCFSFVVIVFVVIAAAAAAAVVVVVVVVVYFLCKIQIITFVLFSWYWLFVYFSML